MRPENIRNFKNIIIIDIMDFLERWGPCISAVLYFAILLVFVDFADVFEIDYDEGYNLAKAALFYAGEPLYQEIWSDQPPLLVYLVAGVHVLFPWSVTAARILILVLTSLMVAGVHASAARIVSPGQHTDSNQLPRILAGFTAVVLFAATERIIRMSFAVDVGTPAIGFATISACALLYIWDDKRPRFLIVSGVFLAIACSFKLFVSFLIPIFLTLSAISATRKPWFKVSNVYAISRVLVLWGAGFLVAAIIVFGPVMSSELVESLVTPHLKAQSGKGPSMPIWIFRRDAILYFVAVIGLIILLVTKRTRSLPIVIWLLCGILVLYFHHPVRSSHRLLVIIPTVIIVSSALGALVGQRGPYRKASLFVAIGMGVVLVIFSMYRFSMNQHWQTGSEPSAFYPEVIRYLEGYENSEMATSRQTLAYRAELLVPPELAVTSEKRFKTGFLTVEQTIQIIHARRVAFVFLDRRWPHKLRRILHRRIKSEYCPVMIRKDAVLWKRRDLLKDGECLIK
jgi:hypothetical protein